MSTDVAKVTSDVSKQYEELKQQITQKQPKTRIALVLQLNQQCHVRDGVLYQLPLLNK